MTLSKNKLKALKKLHQRKYREQEQMYLIEGYHLVEEAYKAKQLIELFVLEGIEQKLDVPYTTIDQATLYALAMTKTPQPIIGLCNMHHVNAKQSDYVLALDGIQDPGNLGTLIRTALGLGFDCVLLSDDCVELYHDKVIRSGQGAHFHLEIKTCKHLKDEIIKLSKTHRVLVTDLQGTNLIEGSLEHVVLVLGNEGNGVSKEILELGFERIKIEMHGIDSLNVGVAGAILMDRIKRF